jgi:hypothetical protein
VENEVPEKRRRGGEEVGGEEVPEKRFQPNGDA